MAGDILNVDICVIGAGSAGLSVAAGAAQLGASTVLIEKGRMGGECLNYGCVPSKALLAAAHAAQAVRGAGRFGIVAGPPAIDAAGVAAHVHGTVAAIAPNDSAERFAGLGVRVIAGEARFSGPVEVVVGGTTVRARRFVVATGSRAQVPPVPGIESVAVLTNETLFDLPAPPRHLIVVGGGPVGVEMAQAHRRLGSAVTMVVRTTILPKDDPELADVIRVRLRQEGVVLHEGATVTAVAPAADGIAVSLRRGAGDERVEGSHLLMATGRRPGTDGLGLEAAGIEHDGSGIRVDNRLRTSNRKVYAIGDVTGRLQFTHVAGYHAALVIRNALFRLPAKLDERAIPRVTYTDPELAQVGMTEATARGRGETVRILRWPFADNDRAQTEATTDGLIKAVVTPRGRILGAGIAGPQAGEQIGLWGLAIQQNLKIGTLAQMIAPYPTLGEVSKRAAGSFFTPTLFGERSKWLVRFLARFG